MCLLKCTWEGCVHMYRRRDLWTIVTHTCHRFCYAVEGQNISLFISLRVYNSNSVRVSLVEVGLCTASAFAVDPKV